MIIRETTRNRCTWYRKQATQKFKIEMVKIIIINTLICCAFFQAGLGHDFSVLEPDHYRTCDHGYPLLFWWARSVKLVSKEVRKGLNTLVTLVSWGTWNFKNLCVFEDLQPDVRLLLQTIRNEGRLRCMAGATDLHELLRRSLPSAYQALVALLVFFL